MSISSIKENVKIFANGVWVGLTYVVEAPVIGAVEVITGIGFTEGLAIGMLVGLLST